MDTRPSRGAILVAGLLLAASMLSAQTDVTLEVTVVDFENADGAAGIAVWNGSEGFPEEIEHAIDTIYVPIAEGVATATLGPFPPGTYAVTVFHDKNDNQEFDKNWIGMPREAWGMTRDPRPRLRAPRFDEADVDFEAGTHKVELRVD